MVKVQHILELNDNNREQISSFLLMVYSNTEITEDRLKRLINFINNRLTDREIAVIIYRFGLNGEKGLTLKETGEIFNLSGERIRQIISKVIKKMRYVGRKNNIFTQEEPFSKTKEEFHSSTDTK